MEYAMPDSAISTYVVLCKKCDDGLEISSINTEYGECDNCGKFSNELNLYFLKAILNKARKVIELPQKYPLLHAVHEACKKLGH
jgi:hypothetical protein